MIVHQLNLANFRGFEQIELQFESDVNVIAGINGVGKSGILHALVTLLSHALRAVTPSQSKALHFTDEDIREGRDVLLASARVSRDNQVFDIVVQRSRTDSDIVSIVLTPPPVRMQSVVSAPNISLADVQITSDRASETETVTPTEQQIKRQLREHPNQPLALFFSPQRSLIKEMRTLPRPTPLGLSAAYQSALEDRRLDLNYFVHWYRVQEHAGRREILDRLQSVVTAFIPEFKALRVEIEPSVRFVVEKSGIPLILNQLSDGERGLLAIIFDITRRLAIANPTLDDPIAEGKAIILIDEIELHLHPTWQRQVLRRLRNTFQSCQFIVTTHSPQVIGQVRPRCLHLLEYSEQEKRIVVHHTSQSFGMDSNWVLQNIMGSVARDYDTEQRLSAAYDQIDAEDLDKARELLTALEVDVGLFPDLQEAKSLLDRLELLASDATD